MAEAVVFYVFGVLAVVASLLMITRKNPVSSAWSLVVVMVSLAALFVGLRATFVAVMQVIVYAGAVMVLFLFVVMLLDLSKDELGGLKVTGVKIFGALLALGVLLVLLTAALMTTGEPAGVGADFGRVIPVARLLFTKYLLPFEVTSVILLTAIIGAVVLAQRKKKED